MRILLPIFLFIAPALHANTQSWTYKQLNKLYQTSPDRCLKLAEFYMDVFKEKPSPYYFASKIYFDDAKNGKTDRVQYSRMRKSIGYAIQFEELSSDEFKDEINWNSTKESISEYVLSLHETMDDDRAETYLKNLDGQLAELNNSNFIESTSKTLVAEHEFSGKVNGSYFGLPSGLENIPSHNLDSEQEMLDLINAERVRQGMDSLIWEEDLARAARYHAFDMANQDYFSHASFDKKGDRHYMVGLTFDRIKKFYAKGFVNSENIAAGNEGAQGTYKQWYNSKGHYENMFNAKSKKVGIGVCYDENSTYGYYWVFCTSY